MPTHPGQIGFIGGGIKEGESLEQAARREFREECGDEFTGQILYELTSIKTSNTVVRPLYMKSDLSIKAFISDLKSNGEWIKSFFIPVEQLKISDKWSYAKIQSLKSGSSKDVFFYSVISYLDKAETLLWGVTASIVRDFLN